MSKTQSDFTPEQDRAMAVSVVERGMTAEEVRDAAIAGELGDGMPSFEPSLATVKRRAHALRQERRLDVTPAERYQDGEARVFELLEGAIREIEDERRETGSVNVSKTRQVAQTLRNLGANMDKRPKPEKAEAEPVSGPEPQTPALLTRLAVDKTQRTTGDNGGDTRAHAEQRNPASHKAAGTDTEGDTEVAAQHSAAAHVLKVGAGMAAGVLPRPPA